MELIDRESEKPRAIPLEIASSAKVIAIIEGGEERPFRGWLVPKVIDGRNILRHRQGGRTTDLEAPSALFVMPPENSAAKRVTKVVHVRSDSERPELVLMDKPENLPSAE